MLYSVYKNQNVKRFWVCFCMDSFSSIQFSLICKALNDSNSFLKLIFMLLAKEPTIITERKPQKSDKVSNIEISICGIACALHVCTAYEPKA